MKSLSLFVGSSKCNAACRHCAGVIHRKHAPSDDGILDEALIARTMNECYAAGALCMR